MKTTRCILLMTTILFFFSGCDKEDLQSPLGSKKPVASEKTVPNISVSASSSCGLVVCNVTNGPVIRYNAINITNNNQTQLPSLTYTLYERISTDPSTGSEVYQPFAQFSCSLPVSKYATPSVNNGARILVYANDPAYTAPSVSANVTLVWGVMTGQLPHTAYRTVAAGNYEGTQCGKAD